jgi:uncharacterized protein YxjI/ribosomal protein L37AE/L43A
VQRYATFFRGSKDMSMLNNFTGKPCPKCGHLRAASETAPEWQCPGCGIAYAKFVQVLPETDASVESVVRAEVSGAADFDLTGQREVFVSQKFELIETFAFETRNRYRILDTAGRQIGYAAEEQTGWMGFVFRQILGHWRTFEIHFYDNGRRPVLHAVHPFRFYFSRLEVYDARQQLIGAIQKRFSILSKRFSVENDRGEVVMEVVSPLWRIWTFPFVAEEKTVAIVNKKWSGILSEMLTDRDNFQVEFKSRGLSNDLRKVVLAAAVYVDLKYFEKQG